MHGGLLYKFFLNTLSPLLTHLLTMITHAAGLSKFLGKIQYPAVIYKAEDEDYLIGGGMGVITVGQHNMEISDSKLTSKPSSNKVIIVRIGEVYFCTAFVGGVLGNKICGFMKGDNGYFNRYKTHADLEKGTTLFLKTLFSLIIGDSNQAFLSQVLEELSKDTYTDIMEDVNCTANTSTEGVEEAAYVGTIPTKGTEVIDKLTGADPGSPAKRAKTFCLQIWRPFQIL